MLGTYILYISTLFFSIFFSYMGVQKNNRINRIKLNITDEYKFQFNSYYFFSILIIILTAGLRDGVGIDSKSYIILFHQFSNKFNLFSLQFAEPGFVFLSLLFNSLNIGYFSIFLSCATITWLFFIFTFEDNYIIIPFALLFIFLDGYFFWTMNGMRQAISISIFTYAIKYIQNKNLIRYLILIFIATLFHYSAILLLPLYFINTNDALNKIFKISIFITLYILTMTFDMHRWVQVGALKLFELMPRYSIYKNDIFIYNTETQSGLGVILKHIVNIFLILYSQKIKKKFPSFAILINLLLFGLVASNITYGIQVLSRFTGYFILIRAISIGILFYYWIHSNLKYEKLLFILFIFIFIAQFLIAIGQSANGCSPYKSVLF